MGKNKHLSLLASIAITMLIAGCATNMPSLESRAPASVGMEARPKSVSISYHVYQEITRYGSELPDYGMYTYVLFPQQALAGSELAERYRALTDAIESNTTSAAAAREAGFPPSEGNIFCLPAGDASARLVLSLKLLNHLRHSGAQARGLLPLDRPGPFLVSLPIPVQQISGEVPMLVADLSSANPKALHEIVAAYKQQIVKKGIDKTGSFESLRLTVLSTLLNFNDDLAVIKVALAAWSE